MKQLMILPIDIGEMSVLFAATSIILLVTSELLSPYQRRIHIFVSRKRLRRITKLFSILFLLTAAIQVYNIITSG